MTEAKKYIFENRFPIGGAVAQWLVTTMLQVDRAFFSYDYETKYFLIVKGLCFAFLLLVWLFAFNVEKKTKSGDQTYRRGVQIFTLYFSLMMVFLLILWPGTWSWDDLWTLDAIRGYWSFQPWQHIITGVYQDIMLQILPFPGGIIFLQNVIVSVCVAFVVTKLEESFNIGRLKSGIVDILLKILPFLLPPVLFYQFSGYRMGLYVYLELTMLVMMICMVKERQAWRWSYTLLLVFLTVICSTWRTESFVYMPCFCVLILKRNKNIISSLKKSVCIVLVILGFIGMNKWQNAELGNSNYQIISLMRPGVELVRAANDEEDVEELAVMDKVTDLQVIRNNPSYNGETLYWSTDCVRNLNDNPDDDYTSDDYKNYVKAFIKLSLKYPRVVLAERAKLFIQGSGITGQTVAYVDYAANLFEENSGNAAAEATLKKGWLANTPVVKHFRKYVIYALGGRKTDGATVDIIYRLVWNAIMPIIVLMYAWIKLLIQKKWDLWIISTAVITRIPIVILTQPAGWFMYLLSFYFLGYVYLDYKMWIHFSLKKG